MYGYTFLAHLSTKCLYVEREKLSPQKLIDIFENILFRKSRRYQANLDEVWNLSEIVIVSETNGPLDILL